MGSDPYFPDKTDELERRVRELEANQDVMSNDIADLRARDEMLEAKLKRLEDALLRLGGELGGDGVDGATVNAIRDGARAAGLLMEPRCTNCSGTGRLLEDHDGRAGYGTCGACGGKGWLER